MKLAPTNKLGKGLRRGVKLVTNREQGGKKSVERFMGGRKSGPTLILRWEKQREGFYRIGGRAAQPDIWD